MRIVALASRSNQSISAKVETLTLSVHFTLLLGSPLQNYALGLHHSVFPLNFCKLKDSHIVCEDLYLEYNKKSQDHLVRIPQGSFSNRLLGS